MKKIHVAIIIIEVIWFLVVTEKMNDKILQIGSEITKFLFEAYPMEYINSVFSGRLDVDDFVDQVILECIKNAFDTTQEKHSLRYFLKESGDEEKIDVRMRYSRLMALVNKAKKKEIEHIQSFGIDTGGAAAPEMNDISDKLDGYQLSEMNFFEITNVGNLELIKSIINYRISSAKKISNSRFTDIANQYDKYVLSWKDRCQDGDREMVFFSLAYFTIEWKYQFNFLYTLLKEMDSSGIKEASDALNRVGMLFGYRQYMSALDFQVTTHSRMVGYREGLISDFIRLPEIEYQYCEMLALVTTFKEELKINGLSIKDWFIQNTDIHDWASFFRDYNVFKAVDFKKDWSGKHIHSIRQLISEMFPENPEKRSYTANFDFGNLIISKLKEELPMDKFDCYIEEYSNESGALCARLREKSSNKKIVMGGDLFVKDHLLRFLSQAKLNLGIMPTIYDRNGTDIVAVRGIKQSEDADTIEVCLNSIGAGYLFE